MTKSGESWIKDINSKPDSWQFNRAVADDFDAMLDKSIPSLARMRELVYNLGYIAAHNGIERGVDDILDLGSSKGGAIDRLKTQFGSQLWYHLIDNSQAMAAAMRDKYKGSPFVKVYERDLRYMSLPDDLHELSLIQAILTLMFIPLEYRLGVVGDCYNRLASGGMMLVVEKVIGDSPTIQQLLDAEYMAFKSLSYSDKEIEYKRLALEHILVSQSDAQNRLMFTQAGFRQIDTFWRDMCFVGYILIKD